MRLPAGVHYTIGGDAESQAEVFGQIFSALGLAVLLMYLILVVQFGSFVDPMAILMSLPLSLIGVMVALAITGMTINIMSLIGVILLMGIVAKNAILLIDFAKWAREERGLPLREALIEAGAIRLRPILMTTFALIAGMIPVALGRGEGAQFRAPLGVAVIGGVITSTFLTLLVIPTGYEILDEWRQAFCALVRHEAEADDGGASDSRDRRLIQSLGRWRSDEGSTRLMVGPSSSGRGFEQIARVIDRHRPIVCLAIVAQDDKPVKTGWPATDT